MDIITILEALGWALAFIINIFMSATLMCMGYADIKWFKNFFKGGVLIIISVLFFFISLIFSNKIFEIFSFSDVIISIL